MFPEFHENYLVVAIRDDSAYHVVNHNLDQDELNVVLSELRRRLETVLVLKQENKHKLNSDFVCKDCRQMFEDRGWLS